MIVRMIVIITSSLLESVVLLAYSLQFKRVWGLLQTVYYFLFIGFCSYGVIHLVHTHQSG